MRTFYQEQQGSVMILAALAMLGFLFMTGLVIDGGNLYMTKSHLQKTANAAVLSGAQELTNDKQDVENVVHQVLQAHHEENSLKKMTIQMENKVTLELRKETPLTFAKLFGISSTPVEAYAAAEVKKMGRAVGAAPLGIDESVNLTFNEEYKLKVDEHDSSTGNFGVLALGGTGAETYEQNLKNGYQSEIKVGDILETQTGNIAGKTKTGIQDRIDACPYPAGETFHRDCPRILLIPVYQPYEESSSGHMHSVIITGFAYFYILEPMDNKDKTISGMFIKRTGTGFFDANSADRGALSIRLTE